MSGDKMEEIKARVNLHAVLPVLGDVEKLDRARGGGVGKARGTLMITVAGMPELSTTLMFKGNGIDVIPDKWRRPSLKLEFSSPKALTESFSGGAERPRIRGILGLLLLPKFIKMSKLMGESLAGDGAPGGVKTRAGLLIKVIVHAMAILVHHHPEVVEMAKDMEGIIQFGIEPDGPFHHINFDKGKASVYDEAHPAPKASISWADPETAVAVLSGKLDAMDALGNQKMKMEGDPGLAMKVGGIMAKVGEILQPA